MASNGESKLESRQGTPHMLAEEIANKGTPQLAFEVAMACSFYFALIGTVSEAIVMVVAVVLRTLLYQLPFVLNIEIFTLLVNVLLMWYVIGLAGGALTGLVGGWLGVEQDQVFNAGLVVLVIALCGLLGGAVVVISGASVAHANGAVVLGAVAGLPVMAVYFWQIFRRQK